MQLRCPTHQTSQLTFAYVKHAWNSHINLYLGKNQLTQNMFSSEALNIAQGWHCLVFWEYGVIYCQKGKITKLKLWSVVLTAFLLLPYNLKSRKRCHIWETVCIYAWACPRCPRSLAPDLQSTPLPSALGAELDGQLRSWLSLTGTSAVVTHTRLAFVFINRKHCKCLARSLVKISLLLPMWTLY